MRTKRTVSLVALVMGAAMACSLNPQPLPPNEPTSEADGAAARGGTTGSGTSTGATTGTSTGYTGGATGGTTGATIAGPSVPDAAVATDAGGVVLDSGSSMDVSEAAQEDAAGADVGPSEASPEETGADNDAGRDEDATPDHWEPHRRTN